MLSFMLRPAAFSIYLIYTAFSAPSNICLDGCVCELDELNPVIQCENGHRTALKLPSQPLSVYEIIALPCNNIHFLPSPAVLKALFPYLKAIDVEGNPNFDCSQVAEFEAADFVITSDCGKEPKFACDAPNKDCDWKCRTLDRIKELFRKMTTAIEKEVKNLQLEEAMQNVQDWFSNAFDKVSKKLSS